MSRDRRVDDELIRQYVEENPVRPGADDVRIVGYYVPVWALIGQYLATGKDREALAAAYELPQEAVDAALAYYRRFKPVIDARIAANAA